MSEQEYFMDRNSNYFIDNNGNKFYIASVINDDGTSTIFYVDQNDNYYIDTEGNYYIASMYFDETPVKTLYMKYIPYIYGEGRMYTYIRNSRGEYKKVTPYIKMPIPIGIAGLAVAGETYVSSSL